MLQLSDLEWGDVITDANGVLVTNATAPDGRACVVKRFQREAYRREIDAYARLRAAGVPTLPVLGSGDDWIAVLHVAEAGYRLSTEADLGSARVAGWVAEWYAALHAAPVDLDGLYRETDVVSEEGFGEIEQRWPELAGALARVRGELPAWRAGLAALPEVATYNDFWFTNLAVDDLGGRALMFDYNLLGRAYRYADVRNVEHALTGDARAAFRRRYEELAGPIDAKEVELDEPLAHVVALTLAARAPEMPSWAKPSYDWLAAR